MTNNKQLITATQRGPICDIEVEIESPMENGMYLPDVELYEMRRASGSSGTSVRVFRGFWLRQGQSKGHDELTKIDEGYLNISSKNLIFAGGSNTISIPLDKIIRVQPYTDGVGIYKEGRQKEYRFVWGNNIEMKLVSIPGDDGKIKPLSGSIVNQFIVNVRKQGVK